jgi:hypothetical protein
MWLPKDLQNAGRVARQPGAEASVSGKAWGYEQYFAHARMWLRHCR